MRAFLRDESGSVLVEFTLLAPMLLLLWVGVLQFGPILQTKVILAAAAHSGAQELASDRTVTQPYTQTLNKVSAAAGSYYSGSTVTVSVCTASGGSSCSACATDSACATSLASAQGLAVNVSLSYPCTLTYSLFSLGSSCSVTASEFALIQ